MSSINSDALSAMEQARIFNALKAAQDVKDLVGHVTTRQISDFVEQHPIFSMNRQANGIFDATGLKADMKGLKIQEDVADMIAQHMEYRSSHHSGPSILEWAMPENHPNAQPIVATGATPPAEAPAAAAPNAAVPADAQAQLVAQQAAAQEELKQAAAIDASLAARHGTTKQIMDDTTKAAKDALKPQSLAEALKLHPGGGGVTRELQQAMHIIDEAALKKAKGDNPLTALYTLGNNAYDKPQQFSRNRDYVKARGELIELEFRKAGIVNETLLKALKEHPVITARGTFPVIATPGALARLAASFRGGLRTVGTHLIRPFRGDIGNPTDSIGKDMDIDVVANTAEKAEVAAVEAAKTAVTTTEKTPGILSRIGAKVKALLGGVAGASNPYQSPLADEQTVTPADSPRAARPSQDSQNRLSERLKQRAAEGPSGAAPKPDEAAATHPKKQTILDQHKAAMEAERAAAAIPTTGEVLSPHNEPHEHAHGVHSPAAPLHTMEEYRAVLPKTTAAQIEAIEKGFMPQLSAPGEVGFAKSKAAVNRLFARGSNHYVAGAIPKELGIVRGYNETHFYARGQNETRFHTHGLQPVAEHDVLWANQTVLPEAPIEAAPTPTPKQHGADSSAARSAESTVSHGGGASASAAEAEAKSWIKRIVETAKANPKKSIAVGVAAAAGLGYVALHDARKDAPTTEQSLQ